MFHAMLKGIYLNMLCIDDFIKENLTEKRLNHTYGVRDTAVFLAKRYGVDTTKAELAALYHDMFKCISEEEMNEYVRRYNLDSKYLNNKNLAHSKVAAEFMKDSYEIKDEELINAVSFHTTGRANMTDLEKIIYLADAIEPSRSYPGVEEIRLAAEKSLDEACILSLSRTADYVKKTGAYLDEDTLQALTHLLNNKQTI